MRLFMPPAYVRNSATDKFRLTAAGGGNPFDFAARVGDEMPMRWALRLGQVAGTEVRIHLTFFLLLAWLGVTHYQAGGSDAAVHGILLTCLVFLCVLLHEFGHAFAARRYGIRTPDITLFPFGGVARLERMPEKPSEEIFVAIAGPLVNVAIAIGLWLAIGGFRWPDAGYIIKLSGSIPGALMLVNVILVAFNLLPAFPMDGGRVLRALLAMRMDHARATQVAARIGQALAVCLGFVGLFGNPMFILVAFFVFAAAASEAGAAQLKSLGAGLRVSAAMVTRFQTLPRNASLNEAADVLLRTSQHEFPVVDPDGTLRGLFTRDELLAALRQRGPDTLVTEVMRSDFPTVHPGTSFDRAFQLLQQSESQALPVTDSEGRLMGLFTLENIGEMMLVRNAISGAPNRDV
jgi:stage IV sporulation protein FB